jgi:hypothetical protein
MKRTCASVDAPTTFETRGAGEPQTEGPLGREADLGLLDAQLTRDGQDEDTLRSLLQSLERILKLAEDLLVAREGRIRALTETVLLAAEGAAKAPVLRAPAKESAEN